MAMKKIVIKGLIAVVAGLGAMVTGWGIGSLWDAVDCAFDQEQNSVNRIGDGADSEEENG